MTRRRRRPAWWAELVPLGKLRRRTIKHAIHHPIPGARPVERVVRRATRGL
jgi:hypothetical protein